MKHPQNRYERRQLGCQIKQLEERHKSLKRYKNRPAHRDVEVLDAEIEDVIHGEFLGYQKAKVLYDE